MKLYLQLFWEFFKTGLFAVGGGYATLPFLTEIANKTGWYTTEQLTDMVAVSESTPGPVGINMATYVGYTLRGIPGALTATIGLIFPSIVVILIVATILEKFRTNKYVNNAFYGLRPASTGLITAALVSLVLMVFVHTADYTATGSLLSLIHIKDLLLAAFVYFMTHYKKTKKLHPIVVIAISAAVGILFSFAGV